MIEINKLCDCLIKEDKNSITDALIIKESLIEDALKESKIQKQNLNKIDKRFYISPESFEKFLEETKNLRNKVKNTPVCK